MLTRVLTRGPTELGSLFSEYSQPFVKRYLQPVNLFIQGGGSKFLRGLALSDKSVKYTRRFAPRVAYAARYARSGRENTPNYYAKRTEVHD